MHAYDFILILFSFVYAAAVTHVLSTAGEIVISSKRIRLSWLNAGWMLAALLFTCAWWIGLWDLRVAKTWGVGSIALYFAIAAGIYLLARLVSPRIPEKGELDLRAFHTEEGRKYLVAYAFLSWVTVAVNAVLGQASGISQWSTQNVVIVPMAFATSAAAISIKKTGIQYLALAVQIGGWMLYFAFLQPALSE
jgi:hypothetical protein